MRGYIALHRIRAVTLDLDDTLWEIEPVISKAETLLWEWLCSNYPKIDDRWTRKSMLELRVDLFNTYPAKAHDFRFLRKMALQRIAESSGYSEALVEPAFAVFDAARNDVELFPEVISELRWLAENYTVLALTNGNANLHTIGIAEYFDDIITAADVGAAKPSRRIFDEAIRRVSVLPEEVLHIGDHPESDIVGARNAGVQTAWINRFEAVWPADIAQPDVIARDMTELRLVLQSAAGGRVQ